MDLEEARLPFVTSSWDLGEQQNHVLWPSVWSHHSCSLCPHWHCWAPSVSASHLPILSCSLSPSVSCQNESAMPQPYKENMPHWPVTPCPTSASLRCNEIKGNYVVWNTFVSLGMPLPDNFHGFFTIWFSERHEQGLLLRIVLTQIIDTGIWKQLYTTLRYSNKPIHCGKIQFQHVWTGLNNVKTALKQLVLAQTEDRLKQDYNVIWPNTHRLN